MNRKIHKLKDIKKECESIITLANNIGFKPVDEIDVRVGNSHQRYNISKYDFISFKKILENNDLFDEIEGLSSKIGLNDLILSASLLQFKKGDFLDWMDYDGWQKNTIGKFFCIAMTDNNSVIFKSDKKEIKVAKYSAIEFNSADVHRIDKSDTDQIWLVLMIPDNITL
jgi:hypothetical protein